MHRGRRLRSSWATGFNSVGGIFASAASTGGWRTPFEADTVTGMDAATGRLLAGADHLRQSIADILSTPIGSRVARREYGSFLPDLVDQPMNAAGRMRLFAATALALLRWEPRLILDRVGLERTGAADFTISVEGRRTDRPGAAATLITIPLPARSA